MKKVSLILAFCLLLGIFSLPSTALALQKGDYVKNTEIRDARDKPLFIPSLKKRLVLIFYVDPDEPNLNREFAEAMKKTNFPAEYLTAMGIVNMKDAPLLPDWLLRFMVRREIESDPRAKGVIFTDPDNLLQKAWKMGSCNNKFVIILIDKSGEVLFIKKDKMTQQEITGTIDLIAKVVDRDKAGK